MKIYNEIKNYTGTQPVVLSIGNFDGLHLGHQYLLQKNIDLALKLGARSALLSFNPHPLRVLKPDLLRYPLSLPDEQEIELENIGIEDWIREPFTQKMREEPPQNFIERLARSIPLKAVVVGPDFCFGKNREGDVNMLQALASQLNFQLLIPESYLYQGQRVSSSLIRKALLNGEVEQAKTFLGKPYTISGEVITGFRRGRTIGFPTANIKTLGAHNLRRGVYSTIAYVGSKRWKAATNIGLHPTFEESKELQVEVHILDFSENIYGEKLKVEFVRFLRPEIKFTDIGSLKSQISKDVQVVRET